MSITDHAHTVLLCHWVIACTVLIPGLEPSYQLKVIFVLHLHVGLTSCFRMCNPSDRLLKIRHGFVKHLTASLEACTFCGAFNQSWR